MARTASSVRDRTPYRSNRRRRWLSIVFSERPRDPAASAFDAPAPTSAKHGDLPVGGPPRCRSNGPHRRRAEGRPARGDRPDRLEDLAHGGGLDEVPGGAALERGAHQGRLVEARNDDDRRPPVIAAGPPCVVEHREQAKALGTAVELDVQQDDVDRGQPAIHRAGRSPHPESMPSRRGPCPARRRPPPRWTQRSPGGHR